MNHHITADMIMTENVHKGQYFYVIKTITLFSTIFKREGIVPVA